MRMHTKSTSAPHAGEAQGLEGGEGERARGTQAAEGVNAEEAGQQGVAVVLADPGPGEAEALEGSEAGAAPACIRALGGGEEAAGEGGSSVSISSRTCWPTDDQAGQDTHVPLHQRGGRRAPPRVLAQAERRHRLAAHGEAVHDGSRGGVCEFAGVVDLDP